VIAFSSTASAAISDPPIVTSGESAARRYESSVATACASRSIVAGGWGTCSIPVVVTKSTS
jgi:hypothetical protein